MVRLTKLTATVSPAAEACGSGVATTVASRAPRIQLFRDIDSSLRKRVERTKLGKLGCPGPFSSETGRWRTAAGFYPVRTRVAAMISRRPKSRREPHPGLAEPRHPDSSKMRRADLPEIRRRPE